MNDWKEYKLGDVANVQTGPFGSQLHMSDYKPTGTPIITVEHLGDNKVLHKNLPLVGDEDKNRLKKYTLKKGDIVFSRVGSVDRCAYISEQEDGWMFSGRLLRVRVNEGIIYSRYLSYYFSQFSFKETIRMIAVGATMPSINTSLLSEVDITLPPLPAQKAIATILSRLDAKIDLLHRQNQTLEQLAETLFRKWFVEDAKEDWEEVTLGDLVETINGVSYKSSELNPSETGMVSLKSFDRNGGFRTDGFKEFTGKFKEKQTVKEGDLIVAHTDITQDAAVIGNPALVIGDNRYRTMTFSMDIVKVVPKFDWISIEFLYYLMRTREFKGHCEGHANGSTVLHLSKQAIPTFPFYIPEKNSVIEFSKHSKKYVSKIFQNHNQIKTLTQLRDSLLPQLMSGAVRVK